VLALLYTLSYAGHWQLLGLILIYDILYALIDENGDVRERLNKEFPMLPYAVYGMIFGYILHPNFPDNVRGFYIQTVMVLKAYWSGAAEFKMVAPEELTAPGFINFMIIFAPIMLALTVACVHAVVYKFQKSRHLYLFVLYTSIYLFLTCKSIRFLEYFVPMAITLIALYFQSNRVLDLVQSRPVKILLVFRRRSTEPTVICRSR
jgi:hypothetical protein